MVIYFQRRNTFLILCWHEYKFVAGYFDFNDWKDQSVGFIKSSQFVYNQAWSVQALLISREKINLR